MSIAEILLKAADLIEPEGAWTQRWWGRDRLGGSVPARSPDACAWCVEGALIRSCDDDNDLLMGACNTFKRVVGEHPLRFGDAPGRTQTECVAALRAAAKTVGAES